MFLDLNKEVSDIKPMFDYFRDDEGFVISCVKGDIPCSKCIFFVGCLCKDE